MKQHFRLDTHPIADPANVLVGEHYRITLLDAGLVRLEYDESGTFEDRASQTVVDRAFPATDFEVTETDDRLEVHTERLHLIYDKGPFTTHGLSVQAKGGYHSNDSVWRYGQNTPNLGGTARTLDDVDGAIPLEDGVLSFNGVSLVDDSRTVLLEPDGWIAPRRPGTLDLYVFSYGRDYRAALQALYRLTGPTPVLPRYALGNWWSRYHPYTADEYVELMDRFRDEGVPLSVAVIDMDWHQVEIDPRYGSGWTGYTWNTDLFPDPARFLADLHERGLATSLNVHPAEGVHAHETAYPSIAKRMGIDPSTELPVNFDPTDPDFMEAYLEELHHPLEDEGVDFWWLDWQQGGVTKVPGLDPLWLLNHFHYLDSGRDGRRPLTFSRYAGIGSHRYPIGFSGDTHITWESLDFQPFFTATASNAGYGWWSHDIGGHFKGYLDDELATRWVQLGVFSPVNRLHSGFNPFNTKEPWRFSAASETVMKDFLRLRHRLLPYLATMNLRAHAEGEPIVQPMYYDHPDDGAAYTVPNQFMFGSELLVAPITSPGGPGHRARPGQGLAARGHLDRRVHRADLHRWPDGLPAPRPDVDPGAGQGRGDRADDPGRRDPRRDRCAHERRGPRLPRRGRRVHAGRGRRRRPVGQDAHHLRRRERRGHRARRRGRRRDAAGRPELRRRGRAVLPDPGRAGVRAARPGADGLRAQGGGARRRTHGSGRGVGRAVPPGAGPARAACSARSARSCWPAEAGPRCGRSLHRRTACRRGDRPQPGRRAGMGHPQASPAASRT